MRRYDKLVRDRIPDVIRENGETPITRTVSGEEYGRRLREKLTEEVTEYLEDGDPDELADVLEVVYALGEHDGLSAETLHERREAKARERGRFADGVVLEAVRESDSSHG